MKTATECAFAYGSFFSQGARSREVAGSRRSGLGRFECIMDGWTECLNQVDNTDNRPDITIFDIETGQTLDLDISLAHPWSVDNVKRASRIDGFAREDQNTLNTNFRGGSESKCVPLVLEHFGRWGEEALRFLDQLSRKNQNVVQFN